MLLLRLPFWLKDRAFSLERLLAQESGLPWAKSWALLPKFELSGPERAFLLHLLERKRNLWLYRCNQQAFAGDFAVVDMSAPRAQHRRVWLVELKSGAGLKVGAGGVQLRNSQRVIEELRSRGVAFELTDRLIGDEAAVAELLGA